VRQTSTSRSHSSPETILPGGFSVVELLVGLALALCLATAAAPLWLSLESAGVQEAERTVQWLQGRVALARLERDLWLPLRGRRPRIGRHRVPGRLP
jgi:Tfp pilus assembly protein PilW